MIVNVLVALGLAPLIGFSAAALGTTVAGWVMLFQLWRGTRPLGEEVSMDARLKRALPRLAAASLIMAVALLVAQRFLHQALATDWVRYGALALLCAIGLAAYGLAVLATGALRLTDIRAAIRRPPRRG